MNRYKHSGINKDIIQANINLFILTKNDKAYLTISMKQ